MYVYLEPEELKLLVAALSPLTIEPAKTLQAKLQQKIDEDQLKGMQELYQEYRTAAFKAFHSDGELEIDDNALVSISEDGGAYVMGWVWVADEPEDEEDAA